VSRYGWFNDFYPDLIHLVTRGEDNTVSDGRLPATYEANLSLGYTFKVGAVDITPTLYVFNLLDRQAPTDINEDFSPEGNFCTNPAGCTPANTEGYTERNFERLGTIPQNSPIPTADWAEPSLRQEPRQFRVGVKVSF
jgi:hypothetical protein